jgi:hypothetical protein
MTFFREFGSSGRAYDKEQVSSALENQIPVHLTLEEFRVVELGPAAALVTYRARAESPGGKADQLSLRSSIWIHRGDDWQMLFHQGTLFAEARTF